MPGTTVETYEPPQPDDTPGASVRQVLAHGAQVGRYVILSVIGRGGMGVVYAAHDPQLDRQVALKLIRSDDHGDEAERLQREAQALAKLDDPHVVAVYDAGAVDGQVFVAMQLVDGQDLAAALETRRRDSDVAQVLSWFRDAGKGLAAAHAARLVHRDFKPSNVLIDKRGRVAVTDFGIARERGHTQDPDGPRAKSSANRLIGTPAYMAPEQHALERATEQSDQFAFCVSLWEALFDQHPFVRGDRARLSAVEIGIAIFEAKLVPPRSRRGVPRRMVDAIARGLSRDPATRWPSMPELLAELEPPRRRTWWPYAAAAGVAAVALGIYAWPRDHAGAAVDCPADARIDRAWPGTARGSIAEALASTSTPYAAQVSATLLGWLDSDASGLHAATREVCAAPPGDVAARRAACLASRVDELAAFTGSLAATPGSRYVDHVLFAARMLDHASGCTAELAPALPAASGADFDASDLDTSIGRGLAIYASGDANGAVGALSAVAKDRHYLSRASAAPRAAYLAGVIAADLDATRSSVALVVAIGLASGSGMTLLELRAWVARVRIATASELPTVAETIAAKSGLAKDRNDEIALRVAGGMRALANGDIERATQLCWHIDPETELLDDRVLAHLGRACELATGTMRLSLTANERPADAALLAQDVSEIERIYGRGHPAIGDTLAIRARDKLIRARAKGLDAAAADALRVDAMSDARTALAMISSLRPGDRAAIAHVHETIADTARERGDAATELVERRAAWEAIKPAVTIYEPFAASVATTYARVADGDDAVDAAATVEAVFTYTPLHIALADALVRAGRWYDAFRLADHLLDEPTPAVSPDDTAQLQWILARAMRVRYGDVAESRRLATSARARFAGKPNHAGTVALIDAWLARRPGSADASP